MQYSRKHRLAEVSITSLSKKGNGVGFIELQSGIKSEVHVPFTMLGDRINASFSRKRSGVYQGKLEEVLQPAADRVVPLCTHFGVCGGCRWQHIPYEMQTKGKEEIIHRAFAHLMTPQVDFHSIIASDHPWRYRNKMEFSFSNDAAKNNYLGLIMDAGRGKVVNLTECHLVETWFIDCLKAVRQWWEDSELGAYHPPSNRGALRTLTLREGLRTGDRMAMLTVSGNPDYALHKHQLDGFVAAVRQAIEPENSESKLSIFLRIQQLTKGIATNFYEMLLYGPDHIREILHIQRESEEAPTSLQFHISPVAFFQPNTTQGEKIYSSALQMIDIPKDAVIYDLYCGTGTLGICAAKFAKLVVGIELSPEAALDAKANVALNGLDNVVIIAGDVGKKLGVLQTEHQIPLPDIVMVDPPRVGLDPEALQNLLTLRPPLILYVSCNYMTQVANIALLVEQGYHIVAIQPVDQFPQTYHIENIVLLSREGK